MSNIADIAKVVLETDSLNADQKMTLLQSMLNNNTIENNNQANDTTNNGTFQVTVKPRSTRNRKSIYGNLRWEDDARIEMFKVCKETFGPTMSGKQKQYQETVLILMMRVNKLVSILDVQKVPLRHKSETLLCQLMHQEKTFVMH